jgi:antitoxin (DNA-binding transcriptional repressor) of toxin-antitoxin stability system
MERITVTQAAREFSDLLNRVCYQGASFELARGNRIVARLVPAGPAKRVTVADLNRVFAELPRLGDDAEDFGREVDALRRSLPPEGDPWG